MFICRYIHVCKEALSVSIRKGTNACALHNIGSWTKVFLLWLMYSNEFTMILSTSKLILDPYVGLRIIGLRFICSVVVFVVFLGFVWRLKSSCFRLCPAEVRFFGFKMWLANPAVSGCVLLNPAEASWFGFNMWLANPAVSGWRSFFFGFKILRHELDVKVLTCSTGKDCRLKRIKDIWRINRITDYP